jgi:CBS domain-containing protein
MGAQQRGRPQQIGGPQGIQGGMPGQMQGQIGMQAGPQLQPVTAEDVIQGEPVTADPDTPVPELVASMDEEDVGSVVVTEDEEPLGIVTDRKIAMAIEEHEDIAEATAGDLISGDLVTASLDDSVFDVLRLFREEGIRRLPVVDDEGTLVGVLALDDIIVLLATEMANVGETVQNQIDRLG